jgi:hypothetical protein
MSDESESHDKNESGGELRKKLEAALDENRKLLAIAKTAKAKELIEAKGYKHVTPADFDEVSLDEIEAKAETLEASKAAADAEALKRILSAKGLGANDLDSVVKGLVGKSSTELEAEALGRLRSLGSLSGDAPSRQGPDVSKLTPDQMIRLGVGTKK